jgi:hypothetical protein
MHCYSWRFMTATVIALTISFVQPGWAASNFQVLHSFPGSGTDGIYPAGALAFDKSGSTQAEFLHIVPIPPTTSAVALPFSYLLDRMDIGQKRFYTVSRVEATARFLTAV